MGWRDDVSGDMSCEFAVETLFRMYRGKYSNRIRMVQPASYVRHHLYVYRLPVSCWGPNLGVHCNTVPS